MSVHKTARGYLVRWRDGDRNRQRTFDRHADAVRWDDETRRRRQLGTLSTLHAPTLTLNAYVAGTWAPTYGVLLAPRTREVYAQSYDKHIAPTLGAMPLHAIKPSVVSRWQSATLTHGHAALRKARTVLSAVMQTAAESELIATNPVRGVRSPKAPLKDEIRPLAPVAVEALRSKLDHRDAVLISLPRVSAEDAIRSARAADVRATFAN